MYTHTYYSVLTKSKEICTLDSIDPIRFINSDLVLLNGNKAVSGSKRLVRKV